MITRWLRQIAMWIHIMIQCISVIICSSSKLLIKQKRWSGIGSLFLLIDFRDNHLFQSPRSEKYTFSTLNEMRGKRKNYNISVIGRPYIFLQNCSPVNTQIHLKQIATEFISPQCSGQRCVDWHTKNLQKSK